MTHPTPQAPADDVIRAAGGLVWRDAPGGRELLVIHRNRYGDWTLPKGKLEPGERWMDAALREVREETGCRAAVDGFAGCVCYTVSGIPKVVLYWHMHPVAEGHIGDPAEVGESTWLPVDEALSRLDYPGERELLERARSR